MAGAAPPPVLQVVQPAPVVHQAGERFCISPFVAVIIKGHPEGVQVSVAWEQGDLPEVMELRATILTTSGEYPCKDNWTEAVHADQLDAVRSGRFSLAFAAGAAPAPDIISMSCINANRVALVAIFRKRDDALTASQQLAMSRNLSTFVGEHASPIGAVIAYAGKKAPHGWALCDGEAVSRTGEWARLFAVISTTYGPGDGTRTFNLPNLCGRVPVGTGTGAQLTARNLAEGGGKEEHVLTKEQMPAHAHDATDSGHTHTWKSQRGEYAYQPGTVNYSYVGWGQPPGHASWAMDPRPLPQGDTLYPCETSKANITVRPTGDGHPHPNMPPFLVLNYLIKK